MYRNYTDIALGNFAAQKEMLAPDHRFHFPLSPQPLDPEAHIGAQRGFKAAVPDLAFTIEDQIAEGDKVVSRFVARGTHRGEFQGLPPTGKAIEFRGINIVHVVNGKNVEEWDALDTLALMQQLGAVPAPGPGEK